MNTCTFKQDEGTPHSSSQLRLSTSEATRRKIEFLRRTGILGQDLKGASVTRACTAADLRQAYRLVHDIYLSTGYLVPEPGGIRLRIYETSPETATFVAKVGDRVVGVLSVVGDSPDLGLPSDIAFKEELNVLRDAGRCLCELTNQAVVPDYRQSAVPAELMRCANAHCLRSGYDDGVATVSPSHNGFYRLLGFHPLGPVRSYSAKVHDPVQVLARNFNTLQEHAREVSEGAPTAFLELIGGNPFLEQVVDWARQARRQFLNPELLKSLFTRERNFLAECSPGERRILQQRWGRGVYEAVARDHDPVCAN